jgi:hypothetical protein
VIVVSPWEVVLVLGKITHVRKHSMFDRAEA